MPDEKPREEILEVFAPTRGEDEKLVTDCPENRRQSVENAVDETIDDSFPASDPPAIPGTTSGSPKTDQVSRS